jgi:hypothetical protein
MPEFLCEQITQIRFRVFLGDTVSTRRNSLTVPVISNQMILLLQRRRRSEQFFVTASLSQKIFVAPLISTPTIRNTSINSMAFFMAMIHSCHFLLSLSFPGNASLEMELASFVSFFRISALCAAIEIPALNDS